MGCRPDGSMIGRVSLGLKGDGNLGHVHSCTVSPALTAGVEFGDDLVEHALGAVAEGAFGQRTQASLLVPRYLATQADNCACCSPPAAATLIWASTHLAVSVVHSAMKRVIIEMAVPPLAENSASRW